MASAQHICAVAAINYVSYSAWTLLNKYQFEPIARGGMGVTTPLIATSLQMLIAGLIAGVVVLGVGVGRGTARLAAPSAILTRIVPLGFSRAVDIGCGNLALSIVSVALQQVIKSTLPLFVMVLSIAFFGAVFPLRAWVSLVPIVVGTAMASAGEVRLAGKVGVCLAAVACIGRALKAVLNGVLLSSPTERLTPLEVLLLEAPTTALMIGSVALTMESFHAKDISWSVVRANLFGGVLMFFNQASYITLIGATSPVTTQIFMNIKMLILIFTSMLLFPTTAFTWPQCVGALVATGGALMYGHAMHSLRRTKERSMV